MPDRTVRRPGNSLGLIIPRALARQLRLAAGDRVRVKVEESAGLEEFDGILRGKATAAELSALADESEELA